MEKYLVGYQRWAILNKEGEEVSSLGWYDNAGKEEVLNHIKNNGMRLSAGEDVGVVEEK